MRQRSRKPSNGLRIVKVRLHGETIRAVRSLECQRPRQSLQASSRYDQRSKSQRLLHYHGQRTSKNLQSAIGGLGESRSKRSQGESCRTGKSEQRKRRKRTRRSNRGPKCHSSNNALRLRGFCRNNLLGGHPGRYKRKRGTRRCNLDQRSITGKVPREDIRDDLVNVAIEGSHQGKSSLKRIIRYSNTIHPSQS